MSPDHNIFVKLTFTAVGSCADACFVTERMILVAIVRATDQSRVAALPVVVLVAVCANGGDGVEGQNQKRSDPL